MLATVEAFLQASGCPEHTRNAWLYLKKAIQELSTTQSPSATSAHDEILKRLSAIEKWLSTPPACLPKPPTYADLARLAPPNIAHEKTVPSSALKEVTVKIMGDPKPSQTSERLVKSINAARSSNAGKGLGVQKLPSGGNIVTADGHETKNLIEIEDN